MTRDLLKRSGVKIKPNIADCGSTKALKKRKRQLVPKLSLEDVIKDIVDRASKDVMKGIAVKPNEVHLATSSKGVIPDLIETSARKVRKHKIPRTSENTLNKPTEGGHKKAQYFNGKNQVKKAIKNTHRKFALDLSKSSLKSPRSSPATLTSGAKESRRNSTLMKISTEEVNCDVQVEILPTFSVPLTHFTKECKVKKCDTLNQKNWLAVDEEISFSSDEEITQCRNDSPNICLKRVKIEDLQSKPNNSMNAKKSRDDKKLVNKKLKHMTGEGEISSLNGTYVQTLNVPSTCKYKKGKVLKTKMKAEVNPANQKRKPVKRKADKSIISDDESNDDVLYSLSDTSYLHTNVTNHVNSGQCEAEISKSESESSLPSAEVHKVKKSKSLSEVYQNSGKQDSMIRLIDSVRKVTTLPVRSVSPVPVYTTVKHSLPTEMDEHASQSLLAQPHWVMSAIDSATPVNAVQACLPISPTLMSYKALLANLPLQLHPKKTNKKGNGDHEDIERRFSVRASECAFKYKEIVIKKCQKYTQIWFNTHTVMKNALNPSVIQEIVSVLNTSRYDDSNLVMLSGLGNVFCSGIDLQYLTKGDRKLAARNMVDALRDLVHKFITFPKLIVAVVTGQAIGLGSALLPLCDIVYASDKATFYLPYAQLAQTPEGCASYTLPHSVGVAMAGELLIGSRKLTAIEACQLGLVSQVYWPTSMMQEVIPRVQNMAQLSGKVLQATKLLMRSHERSKLDLTNKSECNLLLDMWPSNECQKAMEVFLSNEKNYVL